MEGMQGVNIFCFQELSAQGNANCNVEDAFSVATGSGWTLHFNHRNGDKKGGGVAIVTSLAFPHSSRESLLEPGVDEGCEHLDIVVVSVSTAKNSGKARQMLVASIYRAPGKEAVNVPPLCKWLKKIKRIADASFGGLYVCGDINLHLPTAGNDLTHCSKQMRSACQKFEGTMFNSGLRLLNVYGTMTRFEDGKRASAIDVTIVGDGGDINHLTFKDSWKTLPPIQGLDHVAAVTELSWPFCSTAKAGPLPPKPPCKSCDGQGAAYAKSRAKIHNLLNRHGLLTNTLPRLDRELREEERPVFAEATSAIMRGHLSNMSKRAAAFDYRSKNFPNAPWTLTIATGMADLANALTTALESVVGARPNDAGGKTGNRRQPRSRGQGGGNRNELAASAFLCNCPTPKDEQPSQSRRQGRFTFWTKACAETKRMWNRANRIFRAAKARHAGPITWSALRVEIYRTRTAHRAALAEAKRKFWGIKQGKLDRFTSTKELHELLDLLQGKWTDSAQRRERQDALSKACAKRGGVCMTDKKGSKISAGGGGLESANLLTRHFAQTTEPMTNREALAITDRIISRRSKESRPAIANLRSTVQHHLEETTAWLQSREMEGQALATTSPEEVMPLPPQDVLNCGKAFSVAEVTACKHKRKGKATWHDKITTEMMDAAGPLWDECYATMLNLILLTGEWPVWFKDARMRHLLKPKANSYHSEVDAKHTRPISILPALAKRADTIMYKRTEYKTEAKDEGTEVGDKQFGFRPQRGCTDNLFSHLQEVKARWRSGWFCVEVCRDGVKAYDKVDHASLLRKLHDKHGITGPLLRMIAGFLRNRTAHTLLGGELGDTHHLGVGVPQGACASPGLYIVDVDEQARLCDNPTTPLFGTKVGDAKVAYYADDGRLFTFLPGPESGAHDWKRQCVAGLPRSD
jgi:hypothetical protein